jgi:hypothetical protein
MYEWSWQRKSLIPAYGLGFISKNRNPRVYPLIVTKTPR